MSKEVRSIRVYFWREDNLVMNENVCEVPATLPQSESLILATRLFSPGRYSPNA